MLNTVDTRLEFVFEVTDDKALNLLNLSHEQIMADYRIGYLSRQISLMGRREVLNGRAKFGIFGAGKEVPQLALARVFQDGDFRSGYYRDQTLMLAIGAVTPQQLFAQLYAQADVEAEPMSVGRQMNGHFATRLLDANQQWKDQTKQGNTAADISPTAGQMPRLVGLGYASRLYRQLDELKSFNQFSNNGNEVAFGTIGDASCAEGMFWEAVNAIGVLGGPVVLSIWDDGYGISVPTALQISGGDLSKSLQGFQREDHSDSGFEIVTVPGWNYAKLIRTYFEVTNQARQEHVPAIIHVTELTQPQGHSTSGSHERYKSKRRLAWEAGHDCLARMRVWLLACGIATEEDLTQLEAEVKQEVRQARQAAWESSQSATHDDLTDLTQLLDTLAADFPHKTNLTQIRNRLAGGKQPTRSELLQAAWQASFTLRDAPASAQQSLTAWRAQKQSAYQALYSRHLHHEGDGAALNVPTVSPTYSDSSPAIPGFEILNGTFDAMFERDARLVAFGEDVGYLGGVNQSWAGLQEKYGPLRVSDTGIRETTIIGQAIGLALRGLRPIAEIQYLDYILYALPTLSDDLATLRWRTAGGQAAPVIIRTRGHRLEGVWHSGSPLAGLINLMRGIHVLVPRNMVQAAGFYNTLLQADEPALVIEPLNGYRLKETKPDNLTDMTTPIGVPEILRTGEHVTLVTYGACCTVALEAAELLAQAQIEVEVVDVQSLLPFDVHHRIVESLQKTNRVLFLDEDVPGGASAFMMQQVLEVQGGYEWLDSSPITLTAQAHRPAYGSDGNYFSKPNAISVFEAVYALMNEAAPADYPLFDQ